MLDNIEFMDSYFDSWDDKYYYEYAIRDTEFDYSIPVEIKTRNLLIADKRSLCIAALIKGYKSKNITPFKLSKNISLFYLKRSRRMGYKQEFNEVVKSDSVEVDVIDPLANYNTTILPCVLNQIKILKFCNKFDSLR